MTSIITRLHHITGYGTAARVPDDRIVVVLAKVINETARKIEGMLGALKDAEAEIVLTRQCIIQAREDNFDGIAHPKFDEISDSEIARYDGLIGRIRIAIASAESDSP